MTEQAEALKVRRAAKSRFTRKKNEFYNTLAKQESMNIIEGKFKELTEAWRTVEGKHDLYVMLLDEDDEQEDPWIIELQEIYGEASSIYNKCASENLLKLKEDEMRAKYEGLAKKKASLEAMFKSSFEQITKMLNTDSKEMTPTAHLRKCERDLATIFNDCKSLHDDIIGLPLDTKHIEIEIEWLRNLHAQYSDISSQIEGRSDEATTNTRIKKESINPLRMEKARLPSFHGQIRDYPRFKSDFTKHVLPTTNELSAPYVLRSCLGSEPLDCVKSVDDNLEEMWERLDRKYGDPTKIMDVVINAIQNFRPIREGESRKLLEFITVVEDGYRDLKRLGLEAEITTTSSVSIIERKLPNDIKKEWSKIVCSSTDPVDKSNKFPALLKFLQDQRKIIEYETSDLRSASQAPVKGFTHYTANAQNPDEDTEDKRLATNPPKCLIHEKGVHWTSECKSLLAKSVDERKQLLKTKGACWSCLRTGHRARDCKRKKACGKNNCTQRHHPILHKDKPIIESASGREASGSVSACRTTKDNICLLQIQKIKSRRNWVNVMWDSAASLCFITNNKAKAEKLVKGEEVELTITKVGGKTERLRSFIYNLPLIDQEGKEVHFDVYGIDKITNDIESINSNLVTQLFKNVSAKDINRPTGEVDVLIGYQYAAYHPQREDSNGHLLLLNNRFGKCIGGSHPLISDKTQQHNKLDDARVYHTSAVSITNFYEIENLGIECKPRCGSCKCGKCAIGSKNYTLQEEKELKLIESKLEYDKENKRWIAEYPWIKDPNNLPDNKRVALAKLISTERRLAKNLKHAETYEQQIQDMLDRNVARKLTEEELATYQGPLHYISHHEVLKPDSKTTPVRIVFNTSASYMGHILNEFWAKGPDLLNSLIGILIRFRENEVAFIGDVRKMYHTVYVKEIEQHTHRFLWRNMDVKRTPDTYVIQRVSFGDKPSGGIATVALRKTAELGESQFPEATKIIKENSYMDDIIDSVNNKESAIHVTKQIEDILDKGGFKMKDWIYSKDQITTEEEIVPTETEKVLGVTWSPCYDEFHFKVKLNLTPKKKSKKKGPCVPSRTDEIISTLSEQLTKRAILSQVNSIYDPLGFAGPFTVRAKILMRELWIKQPQLGWDESVPDEYIDSWKSFFDDMNDMNSVKNMRCIKPYKHRGDPTLVIFSDGSKDAYGACAYVRWQLPDGKYDSRLLISKNRLAPLKTMSIDRIELCAAVISKRLRKTITTECRYKFERIYHIVDSQIVHAT